jgi:hypothetical protein
MAQPERDLVGRGRPDPGHRGQRADQVSAAGTVVKHDLPHGGACREGGQGPGRRRRQVKVGQVSRR